MTMQPPSLEDAERSAHMQAVRDAVQANQSSLAALTRLLALGANQLPSGLFVFDGQNAWPVTPPSGRVAPVPLDRMILPSSQDLSAPLVIDNVERDAPGWTAQRADARLPAVQALATLPWRADGRVVGCVSM